MTCAFTQGFPESRVVQQNVFHPLANLTRIQRLFTHDGVRIKSIHHGIEQFAAEIRRITELCGATIPDRLSQLLAKYGHSPVDMEQAGIEYACEQIQGLVLQGVDGIHLYTMNKPAQTKQILQMTGLVDL